MLYIAFPAGAWRLSLRSPCRHVCRQSAFGDGLQANPTASAHRVEQLVIKGHLARFRVSCHHGVQYSAHLIFATPGKPSESGLAIRRPAPPGALKSPCCIPMQTRTWQRWVRHFPYEQVFFLQRSAVPCLGRFCGRQHPCRPAFSGCAPGFFVPRNAGPDQRQRLLL